jgi:hypothetical protein
MVGSHLKNGRRKDRFRFLVGNSKTKDPRKIWADVVQREALQIQGIRGWRRRAGDREDWRRLLRGAKIQKGL